MTTALTIDAQPASEYCRACKLEYPASRGSAYVNGTPFAIYVAGMHACEKGGSAIAVPFPSPAGEPPRAATVQVWGVNEEFQMSVLEPAQSPWLSHTYLGRMLSRAEALEPAFKESLFRVTDAIVYQNCQVRGFFAWLDRPSANNGT
jgi:hypothetical protein